MTVVDFSCAIAEYCEYQSDCSSHVTISPGRQAHWPCQRERTAPYRTSACMPTLQSKNAIIHKTRTSLGRGGDEIEVTHIYIHTRNYVIISYLSRDSISMTRLMKFPLHTESRLQSLDVPSPPQTSGPRD